MIYNKDYKEILKTLDKENTLIITDPPYNVGWTYDTYKDKEATVRVISATSKNKKGGVDYLVNCPLCNQIMKGKKNSCHRFYCNNKHKIRISNKEGVLQWD